MKKYIMLLFLIACNSPNFKAGDCIQKPDEVYRWQVMKIENDFMHIESIGKTPSIQKQVPVSNAWMTSSCH